MQEEEICSIQHKEKVSWNVARQMYLARSDEGARRTYAQMVKSAKQQGQEKRTARSVGNKRKRIEDSSRDLTHKKGRADASAEEYRSDYSD